MRTAIACLVMVGLVFAQGADKKKAKIDWDPIKPSKAGDEVRVIVKDKPATYYRLTASTPIELKVKGPVKVRVYARCELPAGSTEKRPYAFTTTVDGKDAKKHDTSSVPSKDARYEGASGAVPGDGDSFIVSVGQGEHTIVVSMDPGSKENADLRFFVQKKGKGKGK